MLLSRQPPPERKKGATNEMRDSPQRYQKQNKFIFFIITLVVFSGDTGDTGDNPATQGLQLSPLTFFSGDRR